VPKDSLFDEGFLTEDGKLLGPLSDSIDDIKSNVPSLEAPGGGKGKESDVKAPMAEMKKLEGRLESDADEGTLPKYPPKGMYMDIFRNKW